MPGSHFFASGGRGQLTASSGTAIVAYAPGKAGAFCNVVKFASTAGATAHTGTLMRDASGTTLTAAAAASQAVINVAAALTDGGGNAIASGDYVAVELNDGSWHVTTFSSASTLAYTLGVNLPVAAAAGNKVFCYGVIADAFHDNQDHTLTANAQVVFPSGDVTGSICCGRTAGAPILFYNANATNASTLNYLMWAYSKKAG